MRDYGKVSPQFWIGETGRKLRGNVEAQLVALYLMTSPHANMIGVFHCPVAYIAHETGLTAEGASKGLQSLIEADFCTYDEASEYVFVHEFAAHQVGESLDPADKRCKGVDNELAKVPKGQCWQAFRARYAVLYNLPIPSKTVSPLEAPSEPHRSQKQKQEQKQNISTPSGAGELSGFAAFWKAWPTHDRKASKGKCLDAWKKAHAERDADAIVAHVERMKQSEDWKKQGGQFIPAPLVYLNNRRWEGACEGSERSDEFAGAI